MGIKQKLLIMIILGAAHTSCSSPMKHVVADIPLVTEEDRVGHFKFEPASAKENPNPLPNLNAMYIDWHENGEKVRSDNMLRAWDFDKDGRYDMVEHVDKQGVSQAAFYDFDGDGKIDFSQKKAPKE